MARRESQHGLVASSGNRQWPVVKRPGVAAHLETLGRHRIAFSILFSVALSCAKPSVNTRTDSRAGGCFRGLEPPYDFVDVAQIKGGSVRGSIRGARGELVSFYFDCGMMNRVCGVYVGTDVPWLGDHEPTKWGHLLAPGSDCEGALVSELRNWASSVAKSASDGTRLQGEVALRMATRLEAQRAQLKSP